MADINYHGQVVVFDLDDTLFRERDFCRSGFRFLCNPERCANLDLETFPSSEDLEMLAAKMDMELTGRRNPFAPYEDFFLPLFRPTSFNLKDHIDEYRSHYPEALHLADGVESVLDYLSGNGIRMALITDGRSTTQRRKIEALGLGRYIAPEMIFISEETGHDKYSRKMFAEVVRMFPEARGFFYVGDNPRKDFYHPNLLGWTTVQVPYHTDNVHPPCEPETPLHAPGIILKNFSELREIVK